MQLYAQGGTAIELDNGTITGNGKVVAIGGDVLWGDGGNAVTGNGTISTNEVFLQGATARTSNKATPVRLWKTESKLPAPEDILQMER